MTAFPIERMTYYYEIAGIHIRCEIPFPLTITSESAPFLISECQPDLVFQFVPVAAVDLPATGGIWMVNTCYHTNEQGYTTYHCPIRGKLPYSRISWEKDTPGLLRCEYVSGMEHMLSYSRNLVELLELESLLLRNDGLLLHASFVRWEGSGILFSAPPGTGKSTQAALWERYAGAEVINGDRTALRFQKGAWVAWGLPYAGTSGIYRNDSAPVAAIVVLRQAKENRISAISPSEAMRFLYPELTIHRWDSGFVSKAVDLFLNLTCRVPVYLLECLPDAGAVETLRERLFGKERLIDDTDSR